MRTGEGIRVRDLATLVQSHYGFLPDPVRLALFGILCCDLDLNSIVEEESGQPRLVLARLFELAAEEQVLSLLWLRTESALQRIDSELHERIRSQVEKRRMWNRIAALSAVDLYRTLHANHVQARLFKGALLSQSLYGDALVRDTRDIDVIVARTDLLRAVEVMSTEGYTCQVSRAAFGSSRFLRTFRQASFWKLRGAIEVDLHWKLCNDWLDTDDEFDASLMRSTATIAIAGATLPWFDRNQLATIARLNLANSHTVDLKAAVDLLALCADSSRITVPTAIEMQICEIASNAMLKRRDVAQDLFGKTATIPQRGSLLARLHTWRRNMLRVTSGRGAFALAKVAVLPRLRTYQ